MDGRACSSGDSEMPLSDPASRCGTQATWLLARKGVGLWSLRLPPPRDSLACE